MKNIWYILVPMIFAILTIIAVGVWITVKKEKLYIISDIVIVLLIIVSLIIYKPYVMDLFLNDTTCVVVEYVEYQSGGALPFARKLIFDDEGKIIELLSPRFNKYHVKMEKGKDYKVEYFNNSKVVKSYTLIT